MDKVKLVETYGIMWDKRKGKQIGGNTYWIGSTPEGYTYFIYSDGGFWHAEFLEVGEIHKLGFYNKSKDAGIKCGEHYKTKRTGDDNG